MNTGIFPEVHAPNKLRIVIIFIVLWSFLEVSQNRQRKKISDLESWHKFEDQDYMCIAFQAWAQAQKWRPHPRGGDTRLYLGTGLRWPLGTRNQQVGAGAGGERKQKSKCGSGDWGCAASRLYWLMWELIAISWYSLNREELLLPGQKQNRCGFRAGAH